MKWLQIAGANHTLAESQEEYETIQVRRGTTYVKHGSLLVPMPNLVAELKPDEAELKAICEGGSIFVEILGTGWPPIGIWTTDPMLRDAASGTA